MPPERQKSTPFWETTPLAQMTRAQWESLCDGCGRCCLHKVEDYGTGEIHYSSVACKLLDIGACRCRNYPERLQLVPDCIVLKPEHLGHLGWLPETCAYRRLDEGRGLADWHPLVSGNPESVHEAGISVRGRAKTGAGVPEQEYEQHLIDWIPIGKRTSEQIP
ncbi:MAG: YcgN family cysteine cluster protein [Gammaproteobacteria bacterium]|nr:YcgN family cysteine cluster protein [Gammaproteobacteria bacterium]